VQTRDALFEWDAEAKLLYLSIGFRDVIDPELQAKLSRGLPTTIVLTRGHLPQRRQHAAALDHRAHLPRDVARWEEAYRVEITRPGGSQVRWTTTVEGVLRRCAEVRRLIAGTAQQIPGKHCAILRGQGAGQSLVARGTAEAEAVGAAPERHGHGCTQRRLVQYLHRIVFTARG
jgi:hypothetical protein